MNLKYFLTLLCSWFAASAFANSAIKPIFPLEKQTRSVPFMSSYIKDQGTYSISSPKEFKKYLSKLGKAKKNATQSEKSLFNYLFSLSEICHYYYVNRSAFSLSMKEKRCHADLIKVGRLVLKRSKVRNNRVIYNVALSYFALRKYRKARHYFQMLITNGSRSPLRRRAEMLSYVIDLEVKKSMSILSYNRLISKLDKRGRLIVNLVTARFLAGINLSGELERNANTSYSSYIRKVSPQISDLPAKHQEEILAYMLGVISRSEGGIDWGKFPIRIETFSYTSSYAALLERKALDAYKHKKYNVASKYYKHLLPMAFKDKRSSAVRRFLNLSSQQFAIDHSIDGYKKAIVHSSEYLKAESDQEFYQKHIKRLIGAIDKKLLSLPKQQLKSTLSTVKVLASLRKNTQAALDGKLVMAKLYLRLNSLKDAVEMYYHLHSLSVKLGSKSLRYLDLAIKYQHQIAKWPRHLVWTPLPSILHNQRTMLKNLYQDKAQALADKHDWEVTAMAGLLAINLKLKKSAYALWTKSIPHKHPTIPEFAVGVMLDDYLKVDRWFDVEELVELSLQNGIKPKVGARYFPLKKIYADALFNTSRLYSKMGKQEESYRQSKEFLKSFPDDKRQPENVFRLTEALLKLEKYVQAMEYFAILINDYPDSSLYYRSLLLAGNLAKMQGREKQAVSFYGLFLKNFPTSPEIKKIVYELIHLYRGKLLYGELRYVYNFMLSSDKFSRVEKQKAELWSMQLENKKGNESAAQAIAHKILSSATQSHQHKAISISSLAEISYEKRDLKALLNLMGKLNRKLPVYQNVYNQLAFYVADTTVYLTEQIANSHQNSPDKYLQYLVSSFANERRGYLEACRFTNSNFCLPAFIGLVNKSASYMDATKAIEPLVTSDTGTAAALSAKKTQFISYLNDQKNFFTKRITYGLRSGNVLREWIANILLLFPDLSLQYVDGYFSNADFVQFDAVGNI